MAAERWLRRPRVGLLGLAREAGRAPGWVWPRRAVASAAAARRLQPTAGDPSGETRCQEAFRSAGLRSLRSSSASGVPSASGRRRRWWSRRQQSGEHPLAEPAVPVVDDGPTRASSIARHVGRDHHWFGHECTPGVRAGAAGAGSTPYGEVEVSSASSPVPRCCTSPHPMSPTAPTSGRSARPRRSPAPPAGRSIRRCRSAAWAAFDDLHFISNRLPDGSLCTFFSTRPARPVAATGCCTVHAAAWRVRPSRDIM